MDGLRGVFTRRCAEGRIHPFAGERVAPPIARPHQILCIGLNYRDHAEETGQPIPEEPILFTKSPNTLVGPLMMCGSRGVPTLWTGRFELGIVVGRRTSYLDTVADARAAIAGFTLVNDVSERTFQMHRGGQWTKGKSAETFNPAGPWLVTLDEVSDECNLGLWLDVNGTRQQDGSTSTMIFSPAQIVHHLSQFMVLGPGDLINSGTPPGVGMGMRPPQYLAAGDVVALGGDLLGRQRQLVVEPR
jgi:2,4-diketo-3-deoxy-L-fuconate hydrolase